MELLRVKEMPLPKKEKKLNKFVISFDMGEPYRHEKVNEALEKMGAEHHLTTTWYLKSTEDIDELHSRLKRLFRTRDKLRVYETTRSRGP